MKSLSKTVPSNFVCESCDMPFSTAFAILALRKASRLRFSRLVVIIEGNNPYKVCRRRTAGDVPFSDVWIRKDLDKGNFGSRPGGVRSLVPRKWCSLGNAPPVPKHIRSTIRVKTPVELDYIFLSSISGLMMTFRGETT